METRLCLALFVWGHFSHAIVADGREPELMPVPIAQLGKQYQLVGKLHAPLGQVVKVQGFVVEGPAKGFEDGPNLRVQRINNAPTQEDIQIPLHDMTSIVPEKKVEFATGQTYELEGYETGEFVGSPSAVWKGGPAYVQTAPYHFSVRFDVIRGDTIAPVRFKPLDFPGRKALLDGVAHNVGDSSVMEGDGWKVIVDAQRPWPDTLVGKPVETLGVYNATSERDTFSLLDGQWRPLRLEDQLGQSVELRGMAFSLNDVWWFEFRGTQMYVENMDQLPGWTRDRFARPLVIRGVLEKARLPRLDQITLKVDRDLAEYFIVRRASWEPLEALLSPERAPAPPRER